MFGDPASKYVGASEGALAVRARDVRELVRAEESTDGWCGTIVTGDTGKVKMVVSAGTGAVAAVACAGTVVSMAISLGEADAVAGVACACQQCPPRAPKNTRSTRPSKFNCLFICASLCKHS